MPKNVAVAAAVIFARDGRFLLGQRAPDTFYPGYWEFPGGKVEAGETPHAALVRELQEELGIQVHLAHPWITRRHSYEHANVTLHFFEVASWSGELQDKVHSALSWQTADATEVGPMLPANGPVLKALRLPRVMGVTEAGEVGVQAQLGALECALENGLRLVQLREPVLEPGARERFYRAAVERCRSSGALAVVNGELEMAQRVCAHGLHLPARQLTALGARPDFEWVGASCHTREELEQAATLGLDYAVLGAVRETLSHPGRRGIGWAAFAELVRELPLPVLAIGGLGKDDMLTARAAGAHGIAAIRSIWPEARCA